MYNFQVGKKYTFDVYPAFLNTAFVGVKVIGIMDAESASKKADIQAEHAKAFSFLPPGTINNYTSYTYIEVLTQSNQKIVLSNVWINESTIVEANNYSVTINLPNIDQSTLTNLQEAIIKLGITNYRIENNII